jgi:type 1 fimbria pilin
MKKISLTALAASLAMFMAGAHAAQAPTAELRVVGTLDVPPCTVTADGDGVYDYGDLGPQDIRSGTATNPLETIRKHWTIQCEGETYLSFTIVDNQADTSTVTDSWHHGLGNVNGTGKLGNYTVRIENPMVDNEPVRTFATSSGNIANIQPWQWVHKGQTMGWAHPTLSQQQIGKTFEADLDVQATLAGTQTMNGPITDDVPLAGSMTLNFAYGL